MSENSRKTWKTKHGARRVRHEEPTLEEAIAAAQGLSDDRSEQVEIAASLMVGVSHDEVRNELLKQLPAGKPIVQPLVMTGRGATQRGVVVEHKRPRRILSSRSN
ncbi:MAG: hypothetical protein ABWY35_13070 [Pseudorhodoplanes sp.]